VEENWSSALALAGSFVLQQSAGAVSAVDNVGERSDTDQHNAQDASRDGQQVQDLVEAAVQDIAAAGAVQPPYKQ
jgi:hypothetical protein